MHITLKQMRYVVALARAGHFGKAAEACHITQSALSQQIIQLEEACAQPLFERRGRSVRLSPFGREFAERAGRVLAAAEDLSRFAQETGGKPLGAIRFGLIPTVAPYLLPQIFPALKNALPDLALTISEARTDSLMEGLEQGTLDIALIATDPPASGPKLSVAPLFSDPFVLAAHQGLEISEPVHLDRLPRDRILLLEEGHCLRAQALAACALASQNSTNTFAATSLSTIMEFVANGQGVTLLPAISLRKEATDPRICIKELAPPGAGRVLSLVWRRTTPFATLYEEIADVIRRDGQGGLSETLSLESGDHIAAGFGGRRK